MFKIEEYNNKQKCFALGTEQLLSYFYYDNLKYNQNDLSKYLGNSNYKFYTTILNISELFHIIQEKEYEVYLDKNNFYKKEICFEDYCQIKVEKENFKLKFNLIYKKIKQYVNVEKYFLDDNFENEYAKQYDNYNIFSFALKKLSEGRRI